MISAITCILNGLPCLLCFFVALPPPIVCLIVLCFLCSLLVLIEISRSRLGLDPKPKHDGNTPSIFRIQNWFLIRPYWLLLSCVLVSWVSLHGHSTGLCILHRTNYRDNSRYELERCNDKDTIIYRRRSLGCHILTVLIIQYCSVEGMYDRQCLDPEYSPESLASMAVALRSCQRLNVLSVVSKGPLEPTPLFLVKFELENGSVSPFSSRIPSHFGSEHTIWSAEFWPFG